MSEAKKTGILLLAFGGADSLESVEPFLKNILKDRPVSPELLKTTKERYALIGGSSPLLKITEEVAQELNFSLLNATGEDYRVYVGMRHWDPFIKDTLKQMQDDGIEKVIAIVMTPYATKASAGGYYEDVASALKELGSSMEVEYVRDWHTHPRYMEALLQIINSAQMPYQPILDKGKIMMIFSAHSLPLSILEGDPYVDMIKETIEILTGKLTVFTDRLGYQSKGGGPVEWIGPSVEELIDEAKQTGMEGILVVPIGFVSDHVETLYDIDILFKERAESQGMIFSRAQSHNASDKFTLLLTELVQEYID